MKTDEKIIAGYIDLVIKNQTTNITITEICKYVGISRKTFYKYFSDRPAITEKIFIDRIEQSQIIGLRYGMSTEESLTAMYDSFCNEKDFFIIAMREDGQNSLFDTIVQRTYKLFCQVFEDLISDKTEMDYLAYKFSSMQALLLKKWMRDGMRESSEFMVKIYSKSINSLYVYNDKIKKEKQKW